MGLMGIPSRLRQRLKSQSKDENSNKFATKKLASKPS
jgi:hypothetical protein